MLGDDATLIFMELLKKLLEIIKTIGDGHGGKPKEANEKKPKIKIGSMSKKDYKNLLQDGQKLNYITLDKRNLESFEKSVKSLGGSIFVTKNKDTNNAVVAFPAAQTDLINTALKHTIGEVMKSDPEKIQVKNGSKIEPEDMKLTADVLRSHDIPVFMLKGNDGKYINVVPKDYDGQYEAAMKEVLQLKKEIGNIDVVRYEQTAPLDKLDFAVRELTEDQAQALSAAISADKLDVKIVKLENGAAAVFTPELSETVDKILNEHDNSIEEAEKYLVKITDNTITMNKDTLVQAENEKSYLLRVPNTSAKDYIRLDKSELEDSEKTLTYKLDMDKKYPIYDENGNLKSEKIGAELAKCYNTKHRMPGMTKETEIVEYGKRFERIDLFNKEQNKLISVGIDSADKIRTELREQGISPKAAEKLLEDINKQLSDEYKQIFNYSIEKSEIVYADIPNIGELIAQSQLSQAVIGKAECIGKIPQDNGSKCCIYDKNAEKFAILPVMPKYEVISALKEMGYNDLTARQIAEKVKESYRDTDIEKLDVVKHENTEIKQFNTNNPELTNLSYRQQKDSCIIVQETENDYKYMAIDKGTSRASVENQLMSCFEIKDELSAAEMMKQLANDGIIEPAKTINHGDVAISQIASNVVEINYGGQSAVMPRNNLDADKLKSMGISDKAISSISKSLKKSEAEMSKGGQTLQSLKSFASKTVSAAKSAAENIHQKIKTEAGKLER